MMTIISPYTVLKETGVFLGQMGSSWGRGPIELVGLTKWIELIEKLTKVCNFDIHLNIINPEVKGHELLHFARDISNISKVSLGTFENEPSIYELCKKLDRLSLSIIFKFTHDNIRTNANLLLLGFNLDAGCHFIDFPKEITDIIAVKMYQVELITTSNICEAIQ